MPLFDTLFNDHASPVLTDFFGSSVMDWEAGSERVTAVRLPSGRTYTDAPWDEFESEVKTDTGISNVTKARLWIPVNEKPRQREQWQIIKSDDTQLEFTVVSFGQVMGGLMCVMLERVDVTKFSGVMNGQR